MVGKISARKGFLMWKKLLQAIFLGLACAGIILAFLPHETPIFSFFLPQPASYKNAVRIASPAVVNVYSQSFQESLPTEKKSISSLGSGVIMTKDGYILTNKHVIDHAEQIVVALQRGQFFNAKLIGSDALTDLAVLKINHSDPLPVIPQNPKRPLHVGDVVLAIGNPYNLGQSVSQGIISALGRNAIGDYAGRQDLIQTDTSINRGNSGGALINTLGELIAINTLSIGRNHTEFAEGLNFATPISLANQIMKKIILHGRVIRGYFGAQSTILFNNGKGENLPGVLITAVAENSPAEIAGIQANDIILKFDGIATKTPAQLMQLVSDTPPQKVVTVELQRLNQKKVLNVTIGELPANMSANSLK